MGALEPCSVDHGLSPSEAKGQSQGFDRLTARLVALSSHFRTTSGRAGGGVRMTPGFAGADADRPGPIPLGLVPGAGGYAQR